MEQGRQQRKVRDRLATQCPVPTRRVRCASVHLTPDTDEATSTSDEKRALMLFLLGGTEMCRIPVVQRGRRVRRSPLDEQVVRGQIVVLVDVLEVVVDNGDEKPEVESSLHRHQLCILGGHDTG